MADKIAIVDGIGGLMAYEFEGRLYAFDRDVLGFPKLDFLGDAKLNFDFEPKVVFAHPPIKMLSDEAFVANISCEFDDDGFFRKLWMMRACNTRVVRRRGRKFVFRK